MKTILVKAGFLIDGATEGGRQDAVMLIRGERIVEIVQENEITVPEDAEVMDYSNETLMPGMINCHVHIDMPCLIDVEPYYRFTRDAEKAVRACIHMKEHLQSGVTYVRNLGSPNLIDIDLARLQRQGTIPGPGILPSGPMLTMTGGHGHYIGLESDGTDMCRKNTRLILKQGAEVVKFMATGGVMTKGVEPGSPQLTFEEMQAIVEEAHKAGKTTATHAQGATGIRNAVWAGVDSVEHGIFLTDEIIDEMVKRETWLVPTLAAPYEINRGGAEAGIHPDVIRKSMEITEAHILSFQKAYKKGVRIATGTDAGTILNPHGNIWRELSLMLKSGMTAQDVIFAATRNGAQLLGIEKDYGTLEKGKVADFIVLKKNPLEQMGAIKDVQAVYQGGIRTV